MSYLEEAAALLRQAAKNVDEAYLSRTARNEARERIANRFAQLAAIERGLLPAELAGAEAERPEVRS